MPLIQTARTSLLAASLALLAAMPAFSAQWEKNRDQLRQDTSKRILFSDSNAMMIIVTKGLNCRNYVVEGPGANRMINFDTLLRMYISQAMAEFKMDKEGKYPYFEATTTPSGSVVVELFARERVAQPGKGFEFELVIGKTSFDWPAFNTASRIAACTGKMGQFFE
jgi:hypothetical protein